MSRYGHAVWFYKLKRNTRIFVDRIIKDPEGKVTFLSFLDFVILEQQGSDPFEEVQQVS